MLKKILVAIDDSAASDWAYTTALELAAGLKAELLMVHALDVFAPASPQHPTVPASNSMQPINEATYNAYQEKWNALVDHFDTLLKQKQATATSAGVKADYIQPYGQPGPAICRAATEHSVDLIVVGNRDQSTLLELVLGSVSNYVLHHSPCSVTVVHSAQRQQATGQQNVQSETQYQQAELVSGTA